MDENRGVGRVVTSAEGQATIQLKDSKTVRAVTQGQKLKPGTNAIVDRGVAIGEAVVSKETNKSVHVYNRKRATVFPPVCVQPPLQGDILTEGFYVGQRIFQLPHMGGNPNGFGLFLDNPLATTVTQPVGLKAPYFQFQQNPIRNLSEVISANFAFDTVWFNFLPGSYYDPVASGVLQWQDLFDLRVSLSERIAFSSDSTRHSKNFYLFAYQHGYYFFLTRTTWPALGNFTPGLRPRFLDDIPVVQLTSLISPPGNDPQNSSDLQSVGLDLETGALRLPGDPVTNFGNQLSFLGSGAESFTMSRYGQLFRAAPNSPNFFGYPRPEQDSRLIDPQSVRDLRLDVNEPFRMGWAVSYTRTSAIGNTAAAGTGWIDGFNGQWFTEASRKKFSCSVEIIFKTERDFGKEDAFELSNSKFLRLDENGNRREQGEYNFDSRKYIVDGAEREYTDNISHANGWANKNVIGVQPTIWYDLAFGDTLTVELSLQLEEDLEDDQGLFLRWDSNYEPFNNRPAVTNLNITDASFYKDPPAQIIMTAVYAGGLSDSATSNGGAGI